MIIKCPECLLPVSDKAISCPHCGNPFKEQKEKTVKRKRLPNGFGQISEMKHHYMNKPYRAMVTMGKTEQGKFIRKSIGYYETYNEAYEALMEYQRNPYDLDKGLTMSELYDKWSVEYFKKLSNASSVRTVTAAWKHCDEIYKMKVSEVRSRHIKGIMDKDLTPHTKSRIKSLMNLMLDYAVEYELTDKNYARDFNISDDVIKEIARNKTDHIPFTDEEMKTLWENELNPIAGVVLVQAYTGFRPQELCLIKLENIHFDEGYIIGGMKTEAGTNRPVPIHPKIRHIVEREYKKSKELGFSTLFSTVSYEKNVPLTYDQYRGRFKKLINSLKLNPEHRPHDPRKHFITMAKAAGLDEYAIKYIVGHAINDITEEVYTKRNISWLISEMNKIQ